MNLTTSNVTLTPLSHSVLAKTGLPSRDAPPDSTSARTARFWDECEKIAIENERRRNAMVDTITSLGAPASEVSHRRTSHSATATTSPQPASNTKFEGVHIAKSSMTPTSSGDCYQTVSAASHSGQESQNMDVTRRPSAATYTSDTSNFLNSRKKSSISISIEQTSLFSVSPRSPPTQDMVLDSGRSRKTSLTDPNEPFLRSQITSLDTFAPQSPSLATTSTLNNASSTHPSTPYSRCSTRPSSYVQRHSYQRNNSATHSEMSTLYSFPSSNLTSPLSLSSVDYALQNIKSAWDDWDSDGGEAEIGKRGGSWIASKRKDNNKSKASSNSSTNEIKARATESTKSSEEVAKLCKKRLVKKTKKMNEDERLEEARRETLEHIRACKTRNEMKKQKQQQQQQQQPRHRQRQRSTGFFRLISCGYAKVI